LGETFRTHNPPSTKKFTIKAVEIDPSISSDAPYNNVLAGDELLFMVFLESTKGLYRKDPITGIYQIVSGQYPETLEVAVGLIDENPGAV
jgi:hypothetical protein